MGTERQRLLTLESCAILDTPADPELDAVVTFAARLTQAPVALVSLVDRDRQWFKARYGIDATETPRDISFCTHTIEQTDPLVVPDARRDHRFETNPLVTHPPNIVFYAGWPLITHDGFALGSLCVIDTVPRELTTNQRLAMSKLATQTTYALEHNRGLARGTLPPNALLTAQTEEVELVSLVVRAVREANKRCEARALVMCCDPSIRMSADPQLIVEIVGSLVANAQSYAPRTSNVTVTVARAWGGVEITVSDFGSASGRVFDDAAACKLAVEAHAGQMWVEDNYPHGACFHVLIPTPPM